MSRLNPVRLPSWPDVAVLLVLALGGACEAADISRGALLRELDGRRDHVQIAGWEEQGWLVFRDGAGQTFRRQPSEIVRFGRGALDRRGRGLLLVDGSYLAGRLTAITDTHCALRGRYFDVAIPRPLVRAALLAAPPIDGLQAEVIAQAWAAEGSDDLVIGVDGDRVRGTLQPSADDPGARGEIWQPGIDQLRLLSDASSLRFPAARVRGIVFSPLLTPRLALDGNPLVVGLADGSRLHVRSWQPVDAERVRLELVCGAELRVTTPQDEPAVVYLSPVRPGEASQQPAPRRLSSERPLRLRSQPQWGPARDVPPEALDERFGIVATVENAWFGNALAMPANSQAVYRGTATGGRLRADVAIQDQHVPDAALGSVRFRVLVAGPEGTLQELWRSEVVRGGQGLLPVDIPLPPTAAIVLAVEAAERGGAGDRAVWIDAVLTPSGT